MIRELDYWYGAQTKRFLEQIVRAFSGYQYMTGWRNGDEPQLKMVPCRVDSRDRLVGHIMRNNSENTLLAAPMITVSHTGLTMRREDVQNLTHIDTLQIHEREVDENGEYTGRSGNRYTVERLMPRPFNMLVSVDIWTSNLDQKHQLLEQILTVIVPTFEIQNSDNPLDWTAKTHVEVEDINWSSRQIPIGTGGENDLEIATITLRVPIWLSPPAKITQQRRIEKIITNIHDDTIEGDTGSPHVVTPGNHRISVSGDTITLLGSKGALKNDANEFHSWADLINDYSKDLRPTLSQLRLSKNLVLEDEDEIVGTLQYDNAHPNKLFWQIDPDTLPSNTLSPVLAIIDPLRNWPDNGLPVSASGQRYLVVSAVGASTQAWGNLVASENDIIQYNNGQWSVVFDASVAITERHYMVNLNRSKQLKWTGENWVVAIDGDYAPGYWRLVL
jgi:hypothetical protein